MLGTQIRHPDHTPGAHDNGAITTIVEIVKFVADQDRRHATPLETANKVQKPVAFSRRQHRCWLVKDEKARLMKKCSNQFDLLPAAYRQC